MFCLCIHSATPYLLIGAVSLFTFIFYSFKQITYLCFTEVFVVVRFFLVLLFQTCSLSSFCLTLFVSIY